WASPDILALIDPMSDLEFQIYSEAKSLDIDGPDLNPIQKTQASYNILTSPQVLSHFVALNPVPAKAINWRGPRQSAAPTPQPNTPTTAPVSEAPERYHINNVPTVIGGPASIYDAAQRAGRDTGPPPR